MIARVLALTVALILAGGGSPSGAAGQLDAIATVQGGGASLTVNTYTDNGQVVGLLGIAGEGKRISFAFRHDEWASLIALWKRVAAAPAGDWKMIGSMAEIGTTNPSFLIMYAGPTISIVIAEPTKSLVFALARSDAATFETALTRTLDRIAP
jgi:hypothetical protein